MKRILLLLIVLSALSFSEVKYEDVSKEHWAYKSINNLIEKGIIKDKQNLFNGNDPTTRYEFAYYLSNLLNEVELEKANKKDLETLKSLIYDFSKELNKLGFDTGSYDRRLKTTEDSIESLNKKIQIHEAVINQLIKRIEVLEKKKK